MRKMLKKLGGQFCLKFYWSIIGGIIGGIFVVYSNYIHPYWYNPGVSYWVGYAYSVTGVTILIIVTVYSAIKVIALCIEKYPLEL